MIQVFPIAWDTPAPHYRDDFGEPRGTPENPRTHQGNDLFAPKGRAVLAPDDGKVHFYVDGIGGQSFILDSPDGWHYYGTHLDRYEGADRVARAGEILGYVGTGGNAAGTPPHLHFQISVAGRGTLDPFAYLQHAKKIATPALESGAPSVLGAIAATAAIAAAAGGAVWIIRQRKATSLRTA